MFKNTQVFPPGGWQFTEEATGWKAPGHLSFDTLVRKVIEHRMGNPKFNLPTDSKEVGREIQEQNGRRIGYHPHYWDESLGDKKKVKINPYQGLPESTTRPWYENLARLVEKAKQSLQGVRTLSDWLGNGGLPVPPEVAQRRADCCAKCPLNEKGDWLDKVTEAVAEAIKEQRSIKSEFNLNVGNEADLGTCAACGCHLPLKVWVPINYIKETMAPEVEKELHQDCWVRKETANRLLVVVPFCSRDADLAQELLQWILDLGGCHNNPCLLVADIKVPKPKMALLRSLATKAFKNCDVITTPRSLPNESWPHGPNWMFETALRFIHANYRQPFYWLEPDCIPLKEHWLEALECEYNACGKPFMGAIVSSSGQPNLPGDHLTGCAIYPWDAHEYLKQNYGKSQAFDMLSAPIVVPQAHHTPLHHHFWGQMNLAPVFKADRSPDNPANTLLLSRIPRECVVHHRNKDGSLIKLLRTMR